MIICPNRYDCNQLLAPRDEELEKRPPLGGKPSTDAGHCHRFMFTSPSKDEQDYKIRMFFDMMASVSGYSTLSLREYEVKFGAYHHFGLDVVYTVETPFTGVR